MRKGHVREEIVTRFDGTSYIVRFCVHLPITMGLGK